MNRSRSLRFGLVAVGAYVGVLFVMSLLVSRPVRPLFEGIGPTAPYRWVNPPREFAAGNQAPTALDTTFAVGAGTALNTSDGQVILNLATGAIAPHAGDASVRVEVDPLDASTLGAAPSPLHADGNAYRVRLAYAPSGAPITSLAGPGNIVLQVPEPAETILYSADGRSWQKLDAHAAGQPTVAGATFTQAGVYLAATSTPITSSGGSRSLAYVVFVAMVALAAALGLGTQLRRRRQLWRRRRDLARPARPSSPPRSKPVQRSTKKRRR